MYCYFMLISRTAGETDKDITLDNPSFQGKKGKSKEKEEENMEIGS